jgi:hypothetical protein
MAVTDTLTQRYFKLKQKDSDPSSKDNAVVLKLDSNMSLVGLSSIVEGVTSLSSTSYTTTANYEPYDPEMDNRFKLIFTIKSFYRDIPLAAYYDAKYNDIFIMPHPDMYGNDLFNYSAIELLGYQIGTHTDHSTGRDVSNTVVKLNLPEPNALESADLVIYNLPGLRNSLENRIRYNANGYTIYKKINMVPLVKVKKSDLFPNINVDLAAVLAYDFSRYGVKFTPNKNPEYIYIPVPL